MNRTLKKTIIAAIVTALLVTSTFAAGLGDWINGYETGIGTGMQLSRGVYWTGSDYQTENYIEYTPSSETYPVVVSGSKLCNYGSFSSMAALVESGGGHVIGGINGDYYVVATCEPLGIVVQSGELWSSDAGHYAVGFFADGTSIFGSPTLTTSIKLGDSQFIMDGVNKTRTDGGAVVYTDTYSTKTKNSGDGTDIVCTVDGTVTMNCILNLTVEQILTEGGAVTIPADRVIISVSANASEGLLAAISAMQVGDTIPLSVSSPAEWANVSYAIGSLYKLVTNGVAETGLPTGTAPRTAIGKKADGTLVLYTNDGRQSGYSVGITMSALANRMIELGCVEATILDGGGSTSMNAIYLGDSSVSQINKPSDGSQRSVSNYIMLVTDKEPTGTATQLALYPLSTNILSGAAASFTVKAADVNGYAASVPSGVTMSVSNGLGTISSDGSFIASGDGQGTVTVSSDGLTSASVLLNVVQTPDILRVFYEGKSTQVTSLDVVLGSTTELMAQAMDNYVYLTSQDSCYKWSVTGSIGSIDANGTFTAASEPATGSIVVSAGDKTVTIPVTVRKPGLFDDVNVTDWFYDAAQYVGENSIMTGTGTRQFSPLTNLTRAMAVTVLYRMENSPAVSAANSFTDVSESDWFASAVAWADSLGIVQGYDGKFDPNAPITREQLATILWRYKGSPAGTTDLSAYTDAANLSSWAQAAMQWAVGQKLISGMTATTIVPQGTANRAQMATILTRMITG